MIDKLAKKLILLGGLGADHFLVCVYHVNQYIIRITFSSALMINRY
jgi:hypothetical protein